MGRTKYSNEERDKILIAFIRAAREIIDEEGIDKVSIRKIASITGMNSATMYLYFPNADALITMASMGYLEKYCRTLAADMPLMKSARDAFIHSWEVFSSYAFAYPQIFNHIFYGQHSVPLGDIVDEYYRLFPSHLENIGGSVSEMLRGGTLEERSWRVMLPLCEEEGISEERARLMNELTLCYFRELLEERCADSDGLLKSAQLTAKLRTALDFLLGCAHGRQ